ncbi:MAG: cytochrome b [Pseudomonadota bacterium]
MTRFLHWVTALLVFLAVGIGYWIANAELSFSALKYFGYHKTLGFAVMALIVVRLLWHRFSRPPHPVSSGVAWQDTLATAVHRLFYLLLLVMPLSGWVASSATGIDTIVFGRWTLPAIAPVNEHWEKIGFLIHSIAAKALVALILIHLGGALFRAVRKRDGTLQRMAFG